MLRRHQLSLYAHISKISWQFDRTDRVLGAVSDPVSNDIRKFEFDRDQTDDFQMVNRLWELVG